MEMKNIKNSEMRLCRWCFEPTYTDSDECYECMHRDEGAAVEREMARRNAKTLADKWAALQGQ